MSEESLPRRPRPIEDEDTRPFWQACREGRLSLQHCEGCRRLRYPPSPSCPDCGQSDSRWKTLSGKGIVYSYVVYRKSFHPAFDDEIPYVVALVDLVEGVRLVTRLVDCRPEQVWIGMTVKVSFTKDPEGLALPLFERV